MVVLDGPLNAHSLPERWLGGRGDAGAALAERVRTAVVRAPAGAPAGLTISPSSSCVDLT